MNGYVFPERIKLQCVGGPADGHSAWVKASDHKAKVYMRKHTHGYVYSANPLWSHGCAMYTRTNMNPDLHGPVEWALVFSHTVEKPNEL